MRQHAERRMERRKGLGRRIADEEDKARLVHDLEVHQIELEIQNEELKAARLEIELSLQRYTELFYFAPMGYATLTLEGRISSINLWGAKLLGKERTRLSGTLLSMHLKVEDRTRFDLFLDRIATSEERERCHVAVRSPAGDLTHLRVTAAALVGGEAPILLSFEDITELVHNEGALRDAAQRKDEFLAVLAHELRNPLAPIRISLSVLGHSGAGAEQKRKAQQVIDRQVAHMTRLIDDLLDVNRIAQGKIRLQCSRVELGEIVRRTLEDYRQSFEQSGIKLDQAIEPGLHEMFADGARLVQALSNLLTNAEKFTPRGGTVTVSLRREGESVVVGVRDTGIGIEPHLLKHVLDPFVQAPQGMDRSRGGLGLGLAMVRGIVGLHQGRVAVYSAGLNKGTLVNLFLPLSGTRLAIAEETKAPAPPTPRTAAAEPRRVLVIDDNLDTADSLREVLELDGHQVQVAYDGEAGLALARTFHPEVVLCDLGLPGMDGYAVAQALRADQTLGRALLIAVSGYRRPEDMERAFRVGFDQHLAKPPRIEELEHLIQHGVPKSPDPTAEEGQLLH
ncbi:MAG TPA: ATP-binding protein [Polyangiaceae bacterium]|nr:ATP-binding protein [Polyangiaceae bacterium]